ncbi:hypothetical protein AAFF_G00334020 [Aldrovandia affinis]|uniref:AIG1-type G domain-containing protein n=1 Tax=Aldrovandia affinis TaxID=143900 RepID=A0AAD7R6U1_9TELE|nr:hypothetical protein AAFF_G00334020 [Aldrovandia affinis]
MGQMIAEIAEDRVVRVILLGESTWVTCETGNCILGRDDLEDELEPGKAEFGVVDSKLVTVVMTPGWGDSKATLETARLKIRRSVQKCPPGPHAILLVVPEWKVEEDKYDWSAERKHVELLGGARVWEHTLVLFYCGDERSRQGLEEKGKQLSLVREECGGRYHVLNIKNRGGTQVTELLEKIMTMKGHGGGYFVPEAETNSEDRVRPEDEEERAESTALIGGEVE